MHLLTLKRLTLHFTNPSVNLEFYVVSLTLSNFNFYKKKPIAFMSAEIAPPLSNAI